VDPDPDPDPAYFFNVDPDADSDFYLMQMWIRMRIQQFCGSGMFIQIPDLTFFHLASDFFPS
jgi:hypothetical protein